MISFCIFATAKGVSGCKAKCIFIITIYKTFNWPLVKSGKSVKAYLVSLLWKYRIIIKKQTPEESQINLNFIFSKLSLLC